MGYSVKSIRKQFAEHGVFYTDLKLAKMLRDIVSSSSNVTEVYDPTCGSGNLLSVFPDEVRKYGQELNPEQADEARQRLINCEIATGDTLTDPAFMNRKFRHIVANYPFSVKWESKEDKHFDNILKEGFRGHNRLHIAAILAAGMLASEVRCYLVDRALELADKLIAECDKGDNNA